MYNEYFGFKETPFSIAPDPRYLFMSEQHREALAHLVFGIHSDGGFVLLTGEVGTGKTTICRCLLEQLPENCVVAFILNPKLTVLELLSTICDEFRIPYTEGASSVKVFVDRINAYLLDANARGLKTVLLIDEAQNLSTEVLEQMRLLTNLETNQRKLLQIILIGQPELRSVLARPELRQLAQRIIARYHLNPLTKKDMSAYVNHRLAVAGTRRDLFPASIMDRLYGLSGGIPRLINLLCDRSLLGAYAENKQTVDAKTLKRAAREVLGETNEGRKFHERKKPALYLGLGFLAAVLLLTASYYFQRSRPFSASVPEKSQETPPKEQEPAGENGKGVENGTAAINQSMPAEKAPLSTSLYRKPIPSPGTREPAQGGAPNAAPAIPDPSEQEKGERGDLGAWGEKPDRYSLEKAHESLFSLWSAAYRPSGSADACKQAESQRLQCFSAAGGLRELSALNRPALLKFYNRRGQKFYATLSDLSDGRATLSSGSDTMTVGVDEIALWWRGDYTLLWRPPPGYGRTLQLGDRGPAVKWLRSHLSGQKGRNQPKEGSELFDDVLAEQVKEFQIAHGLKPDGFAGPQTLIRLHTGIEGGIPLLMGKKKDAQ